MFLIDSHRHNGSSKSFQLWTCHILTMQLDQRRSENNRVKSNMMPSPRFYKDFFLSIISHFEHVIGLLLSENNKSGQLEYKRIWSLQCFTKRQCTILLFGAISTSLCLLMALWFESWPSFSMSVLSVNTRFLQCNDLVTLGSTTPWPHLHSSILIAT